jgi:hypothetical protein
MKYSAEMGSGAVYITSFIMIVLGAQKLVVGEDSQTHRQDGDRISLL